MTDCVTCFLISESFLFVSWLPKSKPSNIHLSSAAISPSPDRDHALPPLTGGEMLYRGSSAFCWKEKLHRGGRNDIRTVHLRSLFLLSELLAQKQVPVHLSFVLSVLGTSACWRLFRTKLFFLFWLNVGVCANVASDCYMCLFMFVSLEKNFESMNNWCVCEQSVCGSAAERKALRSWVCMLVRSSRV